LFNYLRPDQNLSAVTNETDNQVVTGVRFVKKKGVVHLEVQQARAEAEGKKKGRLSTNELHVK
jgi:hypothetical protein